MYFIDLDFCGDIKTVEKLTKKHKLTFKVIEEHGPGGGWPLVEFIGPKNNLIKFIVIDYDPDNLSGDFEDYFDWIEEYKQ